MALESLPNGYRAVVLGASGGLGAAFVTALSADPRCAEVHAGSRRDMATVLPKSRWFHFEFENEASIKEGIELCVVKGPLHLVVVATGLLHDEYVKPEKSWRSLSADSLSKVFTTNTIGPALIAKHALGYLASGEKAVFAVLSARVGSISDNRLGGWHAYRASKAALNMLIRNFAIELAVRNKSAICVGIHPGTVDTALSQPFQSGIKPERLFSPASSVECLLGVLDELTPAQTGKLFAWDGAEIGF